MSLLERLFTHRSRRYFVIALSAVLLAGLSYGYVQLAGHQQQSRYTESRNLRLQQSIAILNQQVSTLPATELPAAVMAAPVFSVIETLRKSGGRLIHWQPGEPRAKLELSLGWDNLPRFFDHLSDCKGISLYSFHLKAGAEPMTMVLTLEFSYENH